MRRRRGFILVHALIVIAGLLALMSMLVASQRVALQQTQNRLRQRRAEAAARSAVAMALATLQDADPNLATLADNWAHLGENGTEEYDLGDATYRLEVVDAGSRINVNTATEEQLLRLPLDTIQVSSLLDWRESSLQARAEGAKDEYYNALPEPYNARLARLTTLSELLLVREWTARDLFSLENETESTAVPPEDNDGNPLPLASVLTVDSGAPNLRADGSARTNFGGNALNPVALIQMGVPPVIAMQIAAGGPYTSFRQLLSQPGLPPNAMQQILNAATFTSGQRIEGKINLNTAPRWVLETLPGMTTDLASAIVERQSSGLSTLGELATLTGASPVMLASVADAVTVGSDTWIVRAHGQSGGVTASFEVVVGLRDDRIQVLTWDRVGSSGVPLWWNWDEESVTTVEAGSVQ